MIIRYTATKRYSSQILFFTEFLSIIIEPSSKAQPTIIWLDKHINAIEYITLCVVRIERIIRCDIGIAVIGIVLLKINDNGQRAARNIPIDLDHDLTLWKFSQ